MTSEPIGSIWCEVCSTLVRDSSHLLKQPHEIAILDDLNLTPPAQQSDDALRVAARRLLASAIPMEGTDGEWDAAIAQMRAALDGTPLVGRA